MQALWKDVSKHIWIVVSFVVTAVVMLVGFFSGSSGAYANLGEDIGEVPLYLVPLIILCLSIGFGRTSEVNTITFCLLFGLVSIVAVIVLVVPPPENSKNYVDWWVIPYVIPIVYMLRDELTFG